MWPDRVSSPGPLALESDALQTALRGPAIWIMVCGYTSMFSSIFTKGGNFHDFLLAFTDTLFLPKQGQL